MQPSASRLILSPVSPSRVYSISLSPSLNARAAGSRPNVRVTPVFSLPRCAGVGVGGNRLELRQGGHSGRPAGVEGQVGEGLDEFVLGEAVGQGPAQVTGELVGPVRCGQDGDGDQAAVAGGQAGTLPDVPEQ